MYTRTSIDHTTHSPLSHYPRSLCQWAVVSAEPNHDLHRLLTPDKARAAIGKICEELFRRLVGCWRAMFRDVREDQHLTVIYRAETKNVPPHTYNLASKRCPP